jgi:hypothetical protein
VACEYDFITGRISPDPPPSTFFTAENAETAERNRQFSAVSVPSAVRLFAPERYEV